MASEFRMTHRVEFADTDAAGIVHFANFFRYMERTEHAFFRSLGLSVHMREGNRILGWPRVRASCDYKSPLRFEDEVEAHLVVRQKAERSLTYDFILHKVDGDRRIEAARGSVSVVCVALDEQTGTMRSVPIPEAIAGRIEAAQAETSASDKSGLVRGE